jgi:hypothetical protein
VLSLGQSLSYGFPGERDTKCLCSLRTFSPSRLKTCKILFWSQCDCDVVYDRFQNLRFVLVLAGRLGCWVLRPNHGTGNVVFIHCAQQSNFVLIWNYGSYRQLEELLGRVIKPVARPLHTQDRTDTKETRTDIHASSGFRNHDQCFRGRRYFMP